MFKISNTTERIFFLTLYSIQLCIFGEFILKFVASCTLNIKAFSLRYSWIGSYWQANWVTNGEFLNKKKTISLQMCGIDSDLHFNIFGALSKNDKQTAIEIS